MKKLFASLGLMFALLSPNLVLAEDAAPAPEAAAVESAAPAAAPAEVAAPAAEAPAPAPAAEAPKLDSGATAWMLTSTALVLLMTIPGLALFYGGMVRKKNVLATMMQSFAITAMITVLWMVAGYSIAFDTTGMAKGVTNFYSFFGSLSKVFLSGMGKDSMTGAIPESVFMTFQMTFAIITPALIAGAFADRMKFSAMMWFTGLWSLLVYAPIAHMVWSGDGGFMWDMGVLDFAGGTVVHINAGVAGLVAALVLGPRLGYGKEPMAPHNLTLTVMGAAMLWVGWFGFNAGSAVAADGRAGMAMAVTQIATGAAALGWMFAEWMSKGKPSVLGIASGAVAGLVAITPASGFVGPTGGLVIGIVAGVVCFWSATSLKRMLKYDDSLDAFGVHGIGGIVGAILTGYFAVESIGGTAGSMAQVVTQIEGVLITIAYTAIGTYIILKVLDLVMGLRVTEEQEREGLDIALHGERVE
ncbi:ammonium transporter [Thiobacillus sp.]|uniref:ammonium transporter n=1 Tax=Thiobacillus sp. TaxID=924 RepID=UPI0011D99EE4|nr:ammonium transporter [Thiobacillus sp.]MBC2729538.1 ammonium transporter [Thiobacillus sp.]MBC2738273.1 ammonium transporter [Thiobacillus sp.]MBC2761547.1 ammonium transporter [Thiobacillus sp.]TXH76207.1 MAG: ammonium transporter [Thiobacillus sp.]